MKRKLLAITAAAVCIGAVLTACAANEPAASVTESTAEVVLTGWQESGGVRRYYLPDGTPASGQTQIDGVLHYFAADGSPISGWMDTDEGRCYLTEEGVRATGWIESDGVRYYLDENGITVSDWVQLEQGLAYFGADGSAVSGWFELGGSRYYMDEFSIPVTGWQEIDGDRYFFGADGVMLTGWIEDGEYRYYLQENGVMASSTLEIDGATYYFTPNGIHIVLVNPWCYVPDDYAANLLPLNDYLMIDASCYDALTRMIADGKAAGYQPRVYSAYRSQSEQLGLFRNKINYYVNSGYDEATARMLAATVIALPGTSEHQLGLAVDIADESYPYLDDSQADTDTQKWLMEHCWEYGFILRYPKDATDITGIIWEPWHYRYVGVEVAKEIYDAGVTLEEYLGFEPNE